MGMMPLNNLHPCYIFVPIIAMAILWGEYYIFAQDTDTRMKLLKYQFLVILEVIMSCLSALLIKFSQRIPALSGIRRTELRFLRYLYGLIFAVVCVMAQLSWLTTALPQSPDPTHFSYLTWCAFGVYAQYLIMALFLTLLWTIWRFCSRKIFGFRSLENRNFENVRALVSFVYTAIISGLCIHGGLQLPQIKEVEIHMGPKLPLSLSGLVIAQLSDIHLGPTSGLTRLRQIVKLTNSIDADVVVVNGDLMDGRVRELGKAVAQLGDIQSKQGVYFTTGNHEYISGGVDELFQFLSHHGVRSLHNSNIKIFGKNKKDFLYIVGIDDIFADAVHYKGHGFHLAAALNGTDSDHVRILIAHQPKAAKRALSSGHFFNLILCGHTHGGQYFPYNLLLWLGNPFFRGLYTRLGPAADSQVYVTEGTVFWGMPFRLGSTMEISKIILKN